MRNIFKPFELGLIKPLRISPLAEWQIQGFAIKWRRFMTSRFNEKTIALRTTDIT